MNGDEYAYMQEVFELSEWCTINNLMLNTSKTKELITNFWRQEEEHATLHIRGEVVERVTSFKCLGTYISHGLKTQLLWLKGYSSSSSPPEDTEENQPVPAAARVTTADGSLSKACSPTASWCVMSGALWQREKSSAEGH